MKPKKSKVPRPFKMPWGKGMIIEEVGIATKWHQPKIQLMEFENGTRCVRFAHYRSGRFQRSPLMIDEKDFGRLREAIQSSKKLKKIFR